MDQSESEITQAVSLHDGVGASQFQIITDSLCKCKVPAAGEEKAQIRGTLHDLSPLFPGHLGNNPLNDLLRFGLSEPGLKGLYDWDQHTGFDLSLFK